MKSSSQIATRSIFTQLTDRSVYVSHTNCMGFKIIFANLRQMPNYKVVYLFLYPCKINALDICVIITRKHAFFPRYDKKYSSLNLTSIPVS